VTVWRTPDGYINNCSLANGDQEKNCQVCLGTCPDRERFTTSSVPFIPGSVTSEAAASFQEEQGKAEADEARVFALFAARGGEGATDYEIEIVLGLIHQTASARRNKLVEKGLVCDSGMKRKTGTGCSATVWILGTGGVLIGPPNDRIRRPKSSEIVVALDTILLLMDHAEQTKGPFVDIPELLAVGEWLRWISRH
jgi:hypothetical protein